MSTNLNVQTPAETANNTAIAEAARRFHAAMCWPEPAADLLNAMTREQQDAWLALAEAVTAAEGGAA